MHTYHGHVLSGYFSRRWERVFRLIERLLAYTSGTLVAVSEEVRDDLVRFGVARADRFTVVPYGFDLPAWGEADDESRRELRGEIGAGEETFVVGWAGRLTAIKRPLDLIRTLRALRDEGVDALLVLVGDGEDRADVEALAAELGVADRCRLVGFQKSIRPWYASFDALLLTSANEGTPVVAIEALAAARPVVATRAGGTGTVVRNGESGYLEAIGDTTRWPTRLALLAREPELRAQMGARGADDVRARFAVGRMADEVEAIYRPAAPVKVLHLHKLTGVSGSEGHLLALLPALRERGVDARFLGLDVPGTDCASLLRARSTGSASRTVPCAAASDVSPRLARDIVRAVRAERPDLVHTHLVHADVYGGDRGAPARDSVDLDAPQRRSLSARPVSLCRSRLRPPGPAADRDLRRSPALPRAGGPRSGETRDDPLRARRAAGGAVRSDPGRSGRAARRAARASPSGA